MKNLCLDILAAFTALTRLPFWRIKQVPKEYFRHITDHWSLVGWLTGGVMAGVLWLAGQLFPMPIAVVLAFIARLLVTGALHEDGLMDICDGFGGGHSRERILEIMKDSHTGAYATIGFVAYALLWVSLLSFFPLEMAIGVVMMADPLGKFVASHIPMLLPYARKEEESKMQVEYRHLPPLYKWLMSALFGLLPLVVMSQRFFEGFLPYFILIGVPLVVLISLVWMYQKRIKGYTGDCIGATFLLCELGIYIGVYFVNNL